MGSVIKEPRFPYAFDVSPEPQGLLSKKQNLGLSKEIGCRKSDGTWFVCEEVQERPLFLVE
ncbi:MAG: hypothetical protein HY912_21130 [Desulfomonile tiedjei]|uniref:Uncharacterized protein n=1 Tax=Desulfomonile tiedjei TaxID=2358 RepID=A0A9D6V4M3_9BACT|nr:hypothetical protein [Desulfomonile tiedjei]